MKKFIVALAAISSLASGAAYAQNVSIVDQWGAGNGQLTVQSGANFAYTGQAGVLNGSITGQNGTGNMAATLQGGFANGSITTQAGHFNGAETIQSGTGHLSDTDQYGLGNMSLTIQSDGVSPHPEVGWLRAVVMCRPHRPHDPSSRKRE